MRTTIDIDDELMAQAKKASELATKRETVEAGLRLLLRLKAQEQVKRRRGKLRWDRELGRPGFGLAQLEKEQRALER